MTGHPASSLPRGRCGEDSGTEAPPSPTGLYGRLRPRQRDIVARLLNGRDLRFWQVNHTVAYSLIARGVVDVEAATCRLRLLPPANAVRRPAEPGA